MPHPINVLYFAYHATGPCFLSSHFPRGKTPLRCQACDNNEPRYESYDKWEKFKNAKGHEEWRLVPVVTIIHSTKSCGGETPTNCELIIK